MPAPPRKSTQSHPKPPVPPPTRQKPPMPQSNLQNNPKPSITPPKPPSRQMAPPSPLQHQTPQYNPQAKASAQSIIQFLSQCPQFLANIEPDANRRNALLNAIQGLDAELKSEKLPLNLLNVLNVTVSNIYSNDLNSANQNITQAISL